MISAQTGASYLSLEHDQQWYRLICRRLSELGLCTKGIKLAPIKRYGEFDWYDTSSFLTDHDRFDLVLCDGPPGSTRGGRHGLLPTMFGHICSGARPDTRDFCNFHERRTWKLHPRQLEPVCRFSAYRMPSLATVDLLLKDVVGFTCIAARFSTDSRGPPVFGRL
jgi:hypothetical protein